LVTILAQKGYTIARRTVAKYRELMNIPVAQVRGLWN
jgi:RNA polymerase sigma-54 factor